MSPTKKNNVKKHIDELLAEALRQPFPASDPVSVGNFTSSEGSSDIVERLRKCLKANAGISGNVELWSPLKEDDIMEAAHEIE
jgi:hypothetical protein